MTWRQFLQAAHVLPITAPILFFKYFAQTNFTDVLGFIGA